ncbi:MAG: hypothetical protein SFY32_10715 [Bacteroidota bacterium]|nr:hypothetical protein [Bacteroidota bacterium]
MKNYLFCNSHWIVFSLVIVTISCNNRADPFFKDFSEKITTNVEFYYDSIKLSNTINWNKRIILNIEGNHTKRRWESSCSSCYGTVELLSDLNKNRLYFDFKPNFKLILDSLKLKSIKSYKTNFKITFKDEFDNETTNTFDLTYFYNLKPQIILSIEPQKNLQVDFIFENSYDRDGPTKQSDFYGGELIKYEMRTKLISNSSLNGIADYDSIYVSKPPLNFVGFSYYFKKEGKYAVLFRLYDNDNEYTEVKDTLDVINYPWYFTNDSLPKPLIISSN